MVQVQGKPKSKKGGKPKKQVKPPPPPVEESSEEEVEDSEEEEDEEIKTVEKPTEAAVESSSSDAESDDDEEEEEKPKPKKSSNGVTTKKDEESESDEEEDDDDEEEEDEDDGDDDEGEEEDDEAEEEDDEEEMEVAPNSKADRKRKQPDTEGASAKKQKKESDGDLVTLMFTNLPEGTNDKTFNKFLNSKGIQCKACRANYGKCKAFIDVSAGDQDKALKLNEVEWKGQEISVEAAAPRNQGSEGGGKEDRDSRTLFVKNLPYRATEDEIAGIFEGVEEVRILSDKATGRTKGIAFVQFTDAESLNKAMESKDEYEMDGRQLHVDYTDSRSQRSSGGGGGGRQSFGGRGGDGGKTATRTLFVKGITEDMSKEDLSKYFETASEVRMITDKDTGKNKFFAYVEFESESLATKCYTEAKGGIEAEDGSTTFYVDYAKDRRSDGGGFRGRGRDGFRGRGRGGFRGRGRGGGFRGRGGRGGFRGRGGHGDGGKRTTFDDED